MKRAFLLAVSAAVFTVMTGCCAHSKTMVWEYRVVHGLPCRADFERKLAEAGREGFVIESSAEVANDGAPLTTVVLKRAAR
jgi:hypothetical protein